MRGPLLAVAMVALVATAGCAALTGGGSGPQPADFPAASEIDAETYERHAAALANTSFTATFQMNLSLYEPGGAPAFDSPTHYNGTRTVRAEPVSQRYRLNSSGRWIGPEQLHNGSVYANDILCWTRNADRGGSVTDDCLAFRFDRSSSQYLWSWWDDRYFDTPRYFITDVPPTEFVSGNVTYERRGLEQFQGTTVMRYEASGVGALRDAAWFETRENASVTAFSATLLLDADGVLRRFGVEYSYAVGETAVTYRFTSDVSDVGETTVQRPPWVGPTVST